MTPDKTPAPRKRAAAKPKPTVPPKARAAAKPRARKSKAAEEERPCAVCSHPRAGSVLRELAAGTATVSGAAAMLRMPPREVRHHLTICDPEGAFDEQAAAAEGPVITPDNLLRLMRESLFQLGELVRPSPGTAYSPHVAIKAAAEQRALFELAGRFTGALTPSGAAAHNDVSPLDALMMGREWSAFTAAVDEALSEGDDRHRLAVTLERLEMERGEGGPGG